MTFDHRQTDRRDKIQIKNAFIIYDCVEIVYLYLNTAIRATLPPI
jgi:hypothetical protein